MVLSGTYPLSVNQAPLQMLAFPLYGFVDVLRRPALRLPETVELISKTHSALAQSRSLYFTLRQSILTSANM